MADVDLADHDTYAHGIPHELFARLRRESPIVWNRQADGPGFWAITSHHLILTVLKAPNLFSSWRGSALIDDFAPEFLAKLRLNMIHKDPPDHTKLKKLVNHVFSPKRIGIIEPRVAEFAKSLVDGVIERGACDWATEVAGIMPLFFICEILGVPMSDRTRLYSLTERMFTSQIVDPEERARDRVAAAEEMRAYAAELGRARRAAPSTDLVSDLLHAEVDGRQLTDEEFQAFFLLLFNAGTETTRTMLCFAMQLLVAHPGELAKLRAEPGLLATAIEEIIRFETPTIQFRRTANSDTELGGQRIAEGDKVIVFLPSANRDEAVFAEPNRFDITRSPNPHLGFGHGAHFCLGAPLARMEATHLFRQVLARLHDLEAPAPPVFSRTNFVRGIQSQPLRFRAP